MELTKHTNVSKPVMGSGAAADSDFTDITGAATENYGPRKMTPVENVILTIKVLAVAGLIMGALWGINSWTSAQ